MISKIKKKPIMLIVISIILLINAFVLMRDRISGLHSYNVANETSGGNVISSEISSVQKFKIVNNEIEAITIYTNQNQIPINNFVLDYELINSKNEILSSGNIILENVSPNMEISIYFAKNISDIKNQELKFKLFSKSKGNLVLEYNDNSDNIKMSILSSEKTDLYKISNTVAIILLLLICIVYFLIFISKQKIYKIYLFSAIILGTIICLLIPIGNVPDENNAHIPTAYYYSNLLLGIDNNDTIEYRQCDLDTIFNYGYVDNTRYLEYLNDLKQNNNLDTRMVDSKQEIITASPYAYTYYLSAIGISIGRILGLNGLLCLLLGRLFNFIVFLIASSYCIKILPAFKGIFAFVCLLPITLQQAFSLSYDSIVITLALLISTLTIKLYHDNRLKKKQYLLLVGSCILIVFCKNFSYSPIILAPISYYIVKIDIVGKLRSLLNNKKNKIIFIITCLLLFMILVFLYKSLRIRSIEGTMTYLLTHPKLLYNHIINTLYENTEFYMSSALGGLMGLLHIKIYNLIMICYYILIFYMLTSHFENNRKLPLLSRATFIFIFIICFFGIMLAMYNWSYDRNLIVNGNILGFQGRYLIPVMPLLMIGVSNKGYIKEDIIEDKTIYLSVLFNIFAIFSLMINLGL